MDELKKLLNEQLAGGDVRFEIENLLFRLLAVGDYDEKQLSPEQLTLANHIIETEGEEDA